MAIEEHDREDLLRDGHAMPIRGELVSEEIELLIGFRKGNQASLYCGADRVFQFDAAGRIRRVFFDGQKFAADQGRLVELVRQTRGGRVELQRQATDPGLQAVIVDVIASELDQVSRLIEDSQQVWRVVGLEEQPFREHVADWIHSLSTPPSLASSPGA